MWESIGYDLDGDGIVPPSKMLLLAQVQTAALVQYAWHHH